MFEIKDVNLEDMQLFKYKFKRNKNYDIKCRPNSLKCIIFKN